MSPSSFNRIYEKEKRQTDAQTDRHTNMWERENKKRLKQGNNKDERQETRKRERVGKTMIEKDKSYRDKDAKTMKKLAIQRKVRKRYRDRKR